MSSSGGQFNIGSDASLTILVNNAPVASMLLTKFSIKQITNRLESMPINDDPNYRENEKGWEGSCEFDRSTSVLDDFFAAKESLRFAGQLPPVIVLNYSINNTDGSLSRFRLEKVAVKLDNAGDHSQDEKVVQTMGWVAGRRKPA